MNKWWGETYSIDGFLDGKSKGNYCAPPRYGAITRIDVWRACWHCCEMPMKEWGPLYTEIIEWLPSCEEWSSYTYGSSYTYAKASGGFYVVVHCFKKEENAIEFKLRYG